MRLSFSIFDCRTRHPPQSLATAGGTGRAGGSLTSGRLVGEEEKKGCRLCRARARAVRGVEARLVERHACDGIWHFELRVLDQRRRRVVVVHFDLEMVLRSDTFHLCLRGLCTHGCLLCARACAGRRPDRVSLRFSSSLRTGCACRTHSHREAGAKSKPMFVAFAGRALPYRRGRCICRGRHLAIGALSSCVGLPS